MSSSGIVAAEELKENHPADPAATTSSLRKFPTIYPSITKLLKALKPRKSSVLYDRQAYLHTLKWQSIHVARALIISGILVLLLWAFSLLPFSKPIKAGNIDYFNPYPVAVGFALFTAFVYGVICYGFPVLLYGFARTKRLLFVAVPALIWAIGNWFMFLALGYPPWWFGLDLVSYGVFALLVLASCVIMNRTFKHRNNFLLIFGLPILVHMLIIAVYAYLIMPFYRSTSKTDTGIFLRLVFRVVIHPVINFINAFVTETFVPDFENTTNFLATGHALGIIVEGAFIGRLMTITIGTGYESVLTSLALGALEIVLRATHSRKRYLINFIKSKLLTCACCQTAEEDMVDTETEKDLRAAYVHYSMTVENSSVFVVTAMFAFYWKHRQVWNLAYTDYPIDEPQYVLLVYSGLIQFAINLVVDYVSVMFERAQKIYTFKPIREEPIRMFVWELLNMLQMMLLLICTVPFLPACFIRLYLFGCSVYGKGIGYRAMQTEC